MKEKMQEEMQEEILKKTKLIDQLFDNSDKVYDDQMKPLIIQTIQDDFRDVVREGSKMLVSLKQVELAKLLSIDEESICIDDIADMRLERKAIQEKIDVVKELYKELFAEDLK